MSIFDLPIRHLLIRIYVLREMTGYDYELTEARSQLRTLYHLKQETRQAEQYWRLHYKLQLRRFHTLKRDLLLR